MATPCGLTRQQCLAAGVVEKGICGAPYGDKANPQVCGEFLTSHPVDFPSTSG